MSTPTSNNSAANDAPVPQIAEVIFNMSLDHGFDYAIPDHLVATVQPGCRVKVKLKHAMRTGYVISIKHHSRFSELQPILGLENARQQIPGALLRLGDWISNYYCCPREHVLRILMPAVVRHGKMTHKRMLFISLGLLSTDPDALAKLSAKRLSVIQHLRPHGSMQLQELLAQTGVSGHLINAMCQDKLLLKESQVVNRDPFLNDLVQPDQPRQLTAQQQQALTPIVESLDRQDSQVFLLHGVTASGKTEVYLHLALDALTKGKQVLFLVPEINLAPQFEQALLARFQQVVGLDGIAVLHSGLADGERLKAWVAIQRGQARVVLGTRMAIFAPLLESGLIIVDEEHDASYKQQEGLRYSARDLAIWRAHQLSIPVVLGSATPSLESWHHANVGRYLKLSLTKRAKTTYMPAIKLVDTKQLKLEQGFAPVVLQSIRERFERGEQSLVFLNRRGYAPVIHCASCSWMSQCPRCSVYTVMHRMPGHGNVLQCHHCGYYGRVSVKCPDCGNQDLEMLGRGTQRVEEFLRDVFPDACVERIDADSTRLKGSARQLFDRVHSGEIDILVGTQMVAKGLDLPRVTLVGVVLADISLHLPDLYAGERTFQLLTQVAGRAGRSVLPGRVIIQTYQPEHPSIQAAMRHDYEGFAEAELGFRREMGYPPYRPLARLEYADADATRAQEEASRLVDMLNTRIALLGLYGTNVIGPTPPYFQRERGKWRWQVMVRGQHLTALLSDLRLPLGWRVDIDPVTLL